MPYFIWRGVDLNGLIHKGKLFARSASELDELLLKRDIALTRCAEHRKGFTLRPIRLADLAYFFRQLAVLLRAGVLLPDALRIVCDQLGNGALQERAYAIVDAVHKGTTFADALAVHKPLFTSMMVHMVAVGEATGSLPLCLSLLADHLDRMKDFRKKMRLAIVVPGITFLFFLLVMGVIFLFVIPHFAHIFASVNRDMPAITRFLVHMSDWLRSGVFGFGGAIFLAIILASVYLYRFNERVALMFDYLALHLPFWGNLNRYSALATYLESLALLLQGGVPLVVALQYAQKAVDNRIIRDACSNIENDVRIGNSLTTALSMQQETIGDQELISLVALAEESGQLSAMLEHAAHIYHDRVQRYLSWITTMLQPLFMLVIGLLVALLIFAVYLPIFSLANIVG